MAQPYTPAQKLRIQFRKSLRKGYVKNAELDPAPRETVTRYAEIGESFIVKVVATTGNRYWFTDRRLMLETERETHELFGYESVKRTHWMFKDFLGRLKGPNWPDWQEEITSIKLVHFDRLEIELTRGQVILEGLDQAYWPIFHFLRWLT